MGTIRAKGISRTDRYITKRGIWCRAGLQVSEDWPSLHSGISKAPAIHVFCGKDAYRRNGSRRQYDDKTCLNFWSYGHQSYTKTRKYNWYEDFLQHILCLRAWGHYHYISSSYNLHYTVRSQHVNIHLQNFIF